MRRWFFALLFLLVACGAKDQDEPLKKGNWYDTALDRDTSYLPMGSVGQTTLELTYGRVAVTAYLPDTKQAPIAVFLVGGGCAKDRYFWFGTLLASHGVAAFILEPPDSISKADDATTVITALGAENRNAESRLFGRLDLSRIVLAGHSLGAYVQSALTDMSTCTPGFCPPGTKTPDGVRGLLLFGFHAQNPDDPSTPTTPMRALEVPWLIMNGSRDGLATPEKAHATLARLQDRPVTLLEIQGMNHFQFTDYVDLATDRQLSRDQEPTVANRAARATAAAYAIKFVRGVLFGETTPDDLGASGDMRVSPIVKKPRVRSNGTGGLARPVFEQLGKPGLDGDDANTDVVATAAYGDATYLLVRNETAGASVWRVRQGKVEEVPFPGRKASLNTIFGAMAVFRGKLYIGLSSGTQGGQRASTGAELWTYDGQTFAPVAAREVDEDTTVTVGSCAESGDLVKVDVSPSIEPSAWAGGMFEADKVLFDVVSNDASSVTLRNSESTVVTTTNCNGLTSGSSFALRRGYDEAGFGDVWNKAVMAMAVHEDRLYVGVGLNLLRGTSLFATSDGTHFAPALGPDFFGKQPTGTPKSSSVTALYSSRGALYVAATGTENYGARLAVWQAGEPRWLVDDGAPIAAGFGRGTFQIASMAEQGGRLWLGGFDFNGAELFSLDDQNRLTVHVGEGTQVPRGFGDLKQIALNLFTARGDLWIGTYANVATQDELSDLSALVLRTASGAAWQLSSSHAFGVNGVGVTRFFEQDGVLYGVASRGGLSGRNSFGPARLYVVRDEAPL